MNTIETIREFLGWCAVINIGLLMWSSILSLPFVGQCHVSNSVIFRSRTELAGAVGSWRSDDAEAACNLIAVIDLHGVTCLQNRQLDFIALRFAGCLEYTSIASLKVMGGGEYTGGYDFHRHNSLPSIVHAFVAEEPRLAAKTADGRTTQRM